MVALVWLHRYGCIGMVALVSHMYCALKKLIIKVDCNGAAEHTCQFKR